MSMRREARTLKILGLKSSSSLLPILLKLLAPAETPWEIDSPALRTPVTGADMAPTTPFLTPFLNPENPPSFAP